MDVSIENVHLISRQRAQFHEARRQEGSQHEGMLRALTTSKSRTQSRHTEPQLQSTPNSNTHLEAGCKAIPDKEERALYEILHALTENLEVLDSVREVFERADPDGSPAKKRKSPYRMEDDADDDVKIMAGVPEPKRVAKGKAVFIVPDKEKLMSPAEKQAKRNAMIAKLVADNTSGLEKAADGTFLTEKSSGARSSVKSQQMLLQQLLGKVKGQHRNGSQLVYRSQMSHGGVASASSRINLASNEVSLLGRSVVNKRPHQENPFREQLELDSKDLIAELLEKTDDYQLTDYQKNQLL